ncbi:MAG TPA: hypothetical protein VL308_16615 [Gemmatimonadaceae bacterium]|nr:hypothetical protein [Gemmatimonadaceae bacterium]
MRGDRIDEAVARGGPTCIARRAARDGRRVDVGRPAVDAASTRAVSQRNGATPGEDRSGASGIALSRRLYHGASRYARGDAVQGGCGDRSGDEPGVPPELQGPGYQRSYATHPSIGRLPFEKLDEYIKRSPLYHVEQPHVPILVHVATNDLEQIDSWNRTWVFFERWLHSRNREPGRRVEPRLPVPGSL